jgi:hypothetical protein
MDLSGSKAAIVVEQMGDNNDLIDTLIGMTAQGHALSYQAVRLLSSISMSSNCQTNLLNNSQFVPTLLGTMKLASGLVFEEILFLLENFVNNRSSLQLLVQSLKKYSRISVPILKQKVVHMQKSNYTDSQVQILTKLLDQV